jgi:hypothetical protein
VFCEALLLPLSAVVSMSKVNLKQRITPRVEVIP